MWHLVCFAAPLTLVRLALVRNIRQILDELAVQFAVRRERAPPVCLVDPLSSLDSLLVGLCGRVLKLLHYLEDG